MEFILKLAYVFGPEGSVRKNEVNKEKRKSAKRRIQEAYKKHGLIFDKPKQGDGNSNNGNMSRSFFESRETASRISGVEIEFILRLKTRTQVIACHGQIDAEKFGNYAAQTLEVYNKFYAWRKLTPTMHKVLFHGREVIHHFEETLIPIGDVSEEAQERRNKDYRYFREHEKYLGKQQTRI